MILWHSEEVERILSAGYRYREQLRREAQEREARAGRPAPVRGAAPLASRMGSGELPRSVLPFPMVRRRPEPPPPPDPEQMRWPEE